MLQGASKQNWIWNKGESMLERLQAIAGNSYIRENEPMCLHTTFKTGGPARIYIEPEDESVLSRVIALCKAENEEYFLLGNGSDLLVSDQGYAGIMVSLKKINYIECVSEDVIEAGAGALVKDVADAAYEQALTGMEFASGIPGSMGGAIFMNAGAYGGEMKEIVLEVKIIEADGSISWENVHNFDLGYRSSNIKRLGRTVIAVRLKLKKGDPASIKACMDDLNQKRRDKQPLEYPSAGSTFKRPEGYFAGKLIDDAGLRGIRLGGAAVSSKHCGFVINEDHATSTDIYRLILKIQAVVKEKFGVDLEPEVKMLGEFE